MTDDNTIDNTNHTTIPLQLSDELRNEEIVSSFVVYIKTGNIIARLNHKYSAKSIVSPIDCQDWLVTIESFEKRAKKKGISQSHIDMLTEVLDKNYECLVERQKGTQEDQEQQESLLSQSKARKALELVDQNGVELFKDQFGTPYAAVRIAGVHVETLPLKDSRFKNWLSRIYYESQNHKDLLNNENITNVLNVLKAKSEFDGITRKLDVRVASLEEEPNSIHYDLTNKDWREIKILAEQDGGWSIHYAPILFRRYRGQLPQVYPSKEYPLDIFDQFMDLINVKDDYDDKILLKCYIISLFVPDIPKPVLMLHGEQGSAKSTLQELIKMIIDPSSIKTVTFPKDMAELVQKLMHNYVCYFDNVSKIPDWISDQLCRAVTGSGFSKRGLYTDDDDIIYNFKRCVGFNGINLGATKADLLDRGIILELERIPKEKEKKLELIWPKFEKLKPHLLGYIFDILAKVLQVKKNGGVNLEAYPRMADFAEISEIISRCMGNEDGVFLRAYYKNIDLQVTEAIEANPVGNAIIKFMEDPKREHEGWKGTSTELLALLDLVAEDLKINIKTNKLWPKAPNGLSRRINEVKTNLREIGIEIHRYVKDQNVKAIEIRKISKISPDRQNDKNQAQVTSDTSGDITKYTGDISPEENNISPDKNPQNYAQSDVSGDIGDSGDITRTSKQQPFSNNNTAKSTIYRSGQSDTWACYNCRIRADKWFMQKHDCSGSSRK